MPTITKPPTGDCDETFEGWAILELMGHRRLGGYVREQTVAGVAMLRIDVPQAGEAKPATQFYSASALYALTPTTEELARAVAATSRPAPVQRWELPALNAPAADVDDAETDEESDEPRF